MRRASLVGVLLYAFALGAAGPVPCDAAVSVLRQQEPAPAPKPVAPPRLSIGGATEVKPYRLVRLTAQGSAAGSEYLWDVEALDDPAVVVDWASTPDAETILWTAPPGRYRVELLVLGQAKPKIGRVRTTVTIGDPPAPAPKPKPVDPKPVDPKPATAFRVIFVREAGAPVPTWLSSVEVREYLDRKCVKGADGRPDWRVYDPQQVLTANESPTVKAFWEAVKPQLGQLPQVAISRAPEDGQLYPMPKTLAEGMKLLKSIGGE